MIPSGISGRIPCLYNSIHLLLYSEEEKRKILESQSETDNVKKIKEYKELLDSGIITQEEFDKKKAELLKL